MKITCLILGVLGLVLVVSIMADTTSSNNPPLAADDTYSITQGETLTTSPQGGLPLSRVKTIETFVEGVEIGDVDNDGTKELVVTKPLNREAERSRFMIHSITLSIRLASVTHLEQLLFPTWTMMEKTN
jgi:hypothetical protein